MDWKDILSSKVEAGELPIEDSTVTAPAPTRHTDTLRVAIDRKGRKGKTATIVEGFTCPDDEVADVARRLKQRLGVGGSSRGGEILIQGDAVEAVKDLLREWGYTVRS